MNTMTKQEQELIKAFRKSSIQYKNSLLALAKGCARNIKHNKIKPDNQRVIPVRVQP